MSALIYVNAVLAVITALGFWAGRTILTKPVTSGFIWKFGLAIVIAMFAHFFLSIFLVGSVLRFSPTKVVFLGLYCASPFLLGALGRSFDDRKWVLPLMSLIFLVGAALNIYCTAI